jgi:3-oxoadipate enol-lactonase
MAQHSALQRVKVGDVELEFEVRGSGEPVLLIHGSVVAAGLKPLAAEPALDGFEVIRYHRRGLGGSSRTGPASIQQQAADGIGLLTNLGIASAHVVGHSYGGAIALQLAHDAGHLVRTLTLLEPALFMVPSGPAFLAQLVPIGETYQRGEKAAAVNMLVVGLGRPTSIETWERALPGCLDQAALDSDTFFQVEVPAIASWTFTEADAGRITQPVLFVIGSDTLPIMSEARDLLHAWLPQTEDLLVPDACHYLPIEQPALIAAGLAAFFRAHPAT